MTEYLMGVDVGTQSAKVLIFGSDGHVVCSGQAPLKRLNIPAPLLAEHPDDDLWDALKLAFQRVVTNFRQTGGHVEDIKAMGICIIRCCRALLRADGSLAWPVINWMDKRLNSPYCHRPEYGEVAWVTTTSGYITHRLTGCFTDTCANYIGWWPMDNNTFDWSDEPELYEECNLTRDMLFDVVKPGEVLGLLSEKAGVEIGLPAGIPVVATAHDKAVEALGSGSLERGSALISLGTYIGAMIHGEKNVGDSRNFWPFQASVPGRYLYECMGVRRGMWTVSWFCDLFGSGVVEEAKVTGISLEELFNREGAAVPAGCDGLVTIHDWAPPAEAPWRKGVMLGFDGRHTRAHIYRSILEGIAFTMKNHVDAMISELGQPLKELIISGGGAESDLIMQIFADIFNIPTRRNRLKSSAAVGCAMNAGMAVGIFASYEEAAKYLVHQADTFQPKAENIALYRQLNEDVYQEAHGHLDSLLQKLSPLVD